MSRFRSVGRAQKSSRRSAPTLVVKFTACATLVAAAYGSPASAGTVDFTSTADGNLATPANWQSGALPAATDTASFGPTTPSALTLQNTSLTLQGMTYSPGTSATSLTLSTTGAGSTALTLAEISNSSLQKQTISVIGSNATLNLSGPASTVAGSVQITTNGVFAAINFAGGANAGTAVLESLNGAKVTFSDSAAGSASISAMDGQIYFTNGSSAQDSTLAVDKASDLGFGDTSTAATSKVTNAGLTTFAGASTAGTAAIINIGSLAIQNSASLGNSTLQNVGATTFSGTASAGQSNIANGGTLVFGDGTTAGTSSITNTASLNFTSAASAGQATISNALTGTIMFSQSADASAAIVNNSGAIDLSGMQQTLSIGSLTGNGSVTLGANTLALGALGHEDLISGVISGGGGINKTGTGVLTLSELNLYTGPTNVLSGTLELDGSLQSSISVDAAALLTGSGSTSSAVNVVGSGALRPIGVFHIGGDLTLAPQALLQVAVTPGGSTTEVTVDGHAAISGASLNVSESGIASDYIPGRSYTILTAQQGVSGSFNQITSSLPLLSPQTHYSADDVTLTFTQVAINGSGPATGINNIIGSGGGTSASSGGSSALVTGLDNLNSTALGQALSSLGASSYGSMRRIALEDADDFPRAVVEHRFSALAGSVDQAPAWVEINARRGADGGSGTGDWVQSGLIGGVELNRAENNTVSVTAQYLRGTMQLGGGNNATSSRFDIGLDATTYRGSWLLDGTLTFGQNSYDMHRFISFGDYRQGPSANSGGDVFSARGEIGFPTSWEGFVIVPYASLQGTMANADSFQEGGGAATDLYGDARRENIITNSLGVRAKSNEALVSDWLGNSSTFFSASLAWLHQSGCLDGQVDSSLLADPTHTPFISTASSIGHDQAALNLALNTRWSSGWHMQLRLAGDAGRAIHSAEAYAGVGYDF